MRNEEWISRKEIKHLQNADSKNISIHSYSILKVIIPRLIDSYNWVDLESFNLCTIYARKTTIYFFGVEFNNQKTVSQNLALLKLLLVGDLYTSWNDKCWSVMLCRWLRSLIICCYYKCVPTIRIADECAIHECQSGFICTSLLASRPRPGRIHSERQLTWSSARQPCENTAISVNIALIPCWSSWRCPPASHPAVSSISFRRTFTL